MKGIVSNQINTVTLRFPLADDKAKANTVSPISRENDGPITVIIDNGKWCHSGAKVTASDFRLAPDEGRIADKAGSDKGRPSFALFG